MKVSLIVAPYNIILDCYGADESKTGKADYGYWIPLGMGYLASSILEAGHKAEIIDCGPHNYTYEDVKRILRKSKPDAIGVSANIAIKRQSKTIVQSLKEEFDVPIFMGGGLATTFPEKTLKENPHLKFILVGEAEKTLPLALEALEGKKSFKDIPGIGYKEDGKIIITEPSKPIMDLDEIPPPAWHLFDIPAYKPLPLQYVKLPVVPYLTSRGCPYGKCAFCFQSGISAQKYRRHSVDRVIDDFKILTEKFKVKEVAFWDDIFFVNEKWVLEFCRKLKEENIDIPWQAYCHINTITKKMIDAAAKTRCWNIAVGYESGNQDVLNKVNKGTTLEKTMEITKIIHDNKITTRGFFVIGLPGDSPEGAQRTAQFAIDMDLTFAQFNVLFPEYGTKLYFDALNKGMITEEYTTRAGASYVPDGFKDAQEVGRAARLVYKRFYMRPGYVLKHAIRALTHPTLIPGYFKAVPYILGVSFNKKNY